MSINGLPTLLLSTIIKANVYLIPGIIRQQTGTFSWGSKRGYNPYHTLVCTFQAVNLARAVSREGCLFSTGYSQNGAAYSPNFVTLTLITTLTFRKPPEALVIVMDMVFVLVLVKCKIHKGRVYCTGATTPNYYNLIKIFHHWSTQIANKIWSQLPPLWW